MNEVKLLNIGGIDQNVKDQYARDIIAPSENGLDSTSNLPVASRHYDAGEFLIGQDRLYYEALVEINVGDTLVVNSNIKATTVSDELVSLRNKSADAAIECIAPIETTGLSTAEYAVGEYLYWDHGSNAGLYKVKVAINIGDAFVVDTNIEAAANVESQILALTNQVSTNTINITNASQKVSNSGDAYSSSKAYKIGDLVIHDNKLYRCTTACSAAAWSVNQSCFTVDTLTNAVTSLNTQLTTYRNEHINGWSGIWVDLQRDHNTCELLVYGTLGNPLDTKGLPIIGWDTLTFTNMRFRNYSITGTDYDSGTPLKLYTEIREGVEYVILATSSGTMGVGSAINCCFNWINRSA